ncbi:hypothetical protein NVP1232O_22 [Vibrio phage 1.232.O._10N.261.51.E11]|nr:hypothetical protein NVP1232O_22 [Vibrio phage 1.232.O._10N.261.51.E11]
MITVNIKKAKNIAHPLRRNKRDAEYKTIDGGSEFAVLNDAGQAKRDSIKAADDALQVEIDNAKTVEDLNAAMAKL